MRSKWREQSWPVIASVLLHGLLVLGFVAAALFASRRDEPQVQPQPIDALVVDSQALHAAQQVLIDRAEQAAAKVRAAAEAKLAAARAAQEAKATETAQAEADARSAADAEETRKATAVAAERQRLAAEQTASAAQKVTQKMAQAQRHAETEQAIREAQVKQASDAKAAAAEAKQAAAKQAAAKQATDAKRAADDRSRQDRESELQRQMADEEHRSAVQASPMRDRYIASLRNKIQSAWIKPPSAHVGVDCMVEVTQVPGGEVTGAHVTQCNGDQAVRQSIENAVYRASPLPDPPDAALFEKRFVFRFRPNE